MRWSRSPPPPAAGPLMVYHPKFPVMWKPAKVHLLWYGSFRESHKQVLRNFVNSLSAPNTSAAPEGTLPVSHWWNINTLYDQWDGKMSTNELSLGLESEDAGRSMGHLMSSGAVFNVVLNAIGSKTLPVDEDAVYAVITDEKTQQKGLPGYESAVFCRDYCGWHGASDYKAPDNTRKQLKFLFVGNANNANCSFMCLSRLINQPSSKPPNGDAGIDGLASILGHELAETITDPTLSTWYDEDGNENADKCSFMFGPATSSRPYNLAGVNNSKFLIQMNWDLGIQACVLGLPKSAQELRAAAAKATSK